MNSIALCYKLERGCRELIGPFTEIMMDVLQSPRSNNQLSSEDFWWRFHTMCRGKTIYGEVRDKQMENESKTHERKWMLLLAGNRRKTQESRAEWERHQTGSGVLLNKLYSVHWAWLLHSVHRKCTIISNDAPKARCEEFDSGSHDDRCFIIPLGFPSACMTDIH